MTESSPALLSRRREVGSASARSLLLTILGEFALPRREPVWTATLLEALARLGVEQRAARQALARTRSERLFTAERHGRRTAWVLTERGIELLDEGAARIYGFMRESHAWDGRWLVLTIPIPEGQRKLRHRLRTQLTWLGFGSPSSGLWVTPDAGQVGEVNRVVQELNLGEQSHAWVGPTVALGDESSLVAAAWDLADVKKKYLDFLEEFEEHRTATVAEVFVAQINIVQAWRRFPFLDPNLPRELMDDDWPGPRAASIFHERHAEWHSMAQEEWECLQAVASRRV